MLITHIIIALSSIILASYLMVRPSHRLFFASYGLIAATLATGTMLAVFNASHLVQACISGLAYTSVVTILTVAAHRRAANIQTA